MELLGKNILFLGSSVTVGSASGGVSFCDIAAEKCKFNCIKEAVSGTTLADINDASYVARLKKLDKKLKVDLCVCQLSTNDASRNIPACETEKAIRDIVAYVKEVFGCKTVFYTNVYYDRESYLNLVELLKKISAELDFDVLNLYEDEKMRAVTPEEYKVFMKDRIHPTLEGYRDWWTPKLVEFLMQL